MFNVHSLTQNGTCLDPDSLRIAIAISLRVGAPICKQHKWDCGAQVNSFRYHLLSSRLNAGRILRHSALNDVICRALISAGIPLILEPVGLDRGDGRRSDGITVFPYKNGKSLYWDAMFVNTFGENIMNQTALYPA